MIKRKSGMLVAILMIRHKRLNERGTSMVRTILVVMLFAATIDDADVISVDTSADSVVITSEAEIANDVCGAY